MRSLVNVQVGPYTLRTQIGLGGAAEVWHATHVDDERAYAVKLLRPEHREDVNQLKALETEFSILEQLRHKALTPGRRWVEIDDRSGYVMDLVPGMNMSVALARKLPFNGLHCLRDLVDVVAFLHENELIHNDIKLENCILRPEGSLALVDLGNVRRMQWTNVITGFFRRPAQQIFGTATYLAPELIAGKRPTVKSDLYAIGVCTFLFLTGKPPFMADTNDERLRANISETPPGLASRIPGIPPGPAAILDRCLAKKADARPESAEEVLAAINDLLTKVRYVRVKTPDPGSLGRGPIGGGLPP